LPEAHQTFQRVVVAEQELLGLPLHPQRYVVMAARVLRPIYLELALLMLVVVAQLRIMETQMDQLQHRV
jgi:hypothetical protein